MKKKFLIILSVTLILFMQINAKHIEANSAIVDESTVKLRILETTDIHSYLLDYNYEKKRKRLNSDITELLV